MIEASGLTKRYGATLAVDGLSFGLRPGWNALASSSAPTSDSGQRSRR